MPQKHSNAAEPIKAALATMDEHLLAELMESAQFALNDVDAVKRVSEEIGVPVERLEALAGIFVSLSVAGRPDHFSIDIVRTTGELDAETAKLADLKAELEP